jgi:ankyrin repeat protein
MRQYARPLRVTLTTLVLLVGMAAATGEDTMRLIGAAVLPRPIAPAGPDTYTVTENAPGRGESTEAMALKEARDFCTQNGRQFFPTTMGQVPPTGYAVTFRCLFTDPAVRQYLNAAGRGDLAAVEALLAKGADVNAKDAFGMTALEAASETGHLDVVQALIDRGADVNAKDNGGLTALIRASLLGHLDVVQALIAKGADVNAKTTIGGLTALMATTNAKIRAVLVEAGARPWGNHPPVVVPLQAPHSSGRAINAPDNPPPLIPPQVPLRWRQEGMV